MYLFSNPRATWVLSKLQGLQYYFLENLGAILKVYESEDFSYSSLIALSNPKILGFLFFNEKWPTWEVKRETFSSEILGNL